MNFNISTEGDRKNFGKPKKAEDQGRRLNPGCPKGEKQGIDDERGRDQKSSSKPMQESAMSNQDIKVSDSHQYAKVERDINDSFEKQRCKANKEKQPEEGKLKPDVSLIFKTYESIMTGITSKFFFHYLEDDNEEEMSTEVLKHFEDRHDTCYKNVLLGDQFANVSHDMLAYPFSKDDSNPPPPDENAVIENGQDDREIISLRDINTAQRFLDYVICLLFVLVHTYNQAHRGRLVDLHEARQHRHLMRQRRLGLFHQGHVVDLAASRRQRQRFRAGIQQGPTVILNRDRPQDLQEAQRIQDLINQGRFLPFHQVGVADVAAPRYQADIQHGPMVNLLEHRHQVSPWHGRNHREGGDGQSHENAVACVFHHERCQGCSRCSNRHADVWCETCRNLFCARCDADHHGRMARQAHQRRWING